MGTVHAIHQELVLVYAAAFQWSYDAAMTGMRGLTTAALQVAREEAQQDPGLLTVQARGHMQGTLAAIDDLTEQADEEAQHG